MHQPASPVSDISLIFIELGAAIIGLAILARVANRFGFSPIPLFLLAGLAFGNGGLLPLDLSEDFTHIGAEIGVVMLLFMLGLGHSGEELASSLKTGIPVGLIDLALNFTPGLLFGFALGWGWLAAILLGGVTYISSSGVVARLLADLKWQANPETHTVLTILIIEDIAMALFLPLMGVLLIGQDWRQGAVSVSIALLTVGVALFVALRFSGVISRLVYHRSDEIVLLTTFGAVLLVAGVAQSLQVSAAIGAFLAGIALSGPIVEPARRVLRPLRDLFAAVFFFFFGLQVNPSTLPPVMLPALALAVVTVITKLITARWATRGKGVDGGGGLRAGALLSVRGEFSIVIAGLGVAAGLSETQLGPLAAAYVLLLTSTAPLLARGAEWLGNRKPPAAA